MVPPLENISATTEPPDAAIAVFCPNGHLIMAARQCSQCGWTRPAARGVGERLWGPVDLGADLGGPGREVFASPAVVQGMAAFPLANGELVGINLSDGRQSWRSALDAGLNAAGLAADGRRFLAGLCDQRPLLPDPNDPRARAPAGLGKLVSVDPTSGKISELWPSDAPLITDPALTARRILVRTPGQGLTALTREPTPRQVWSQSLESWWAAAPYLAGETVLVSDGQPMLGLWRLRAFAEGDGQPLWEHPTPAMPSFRPVHWQDTLYLRSGQTNILALDLKNGKLRWQKEFKRLYGRLCAAQGDLLLACRGPAASDQPGHYLVQSYQADGKLKWEIPLPGGARPRLGPTLVEGLILVACDDGMLLAYAAGGQRPLWQVRFGGPENPPRMELIESQGILLLGTARGTVMAVQAAQSLAEVCDPQVYLQTGELESAAAAYALCKEYAVAADLYAHRLNSPQRALALLEHANLLDQAWQMAREFSLHPRALAYAEKRNNPADQAEALSAMGDHLAAARKFLEANDRPAAARSFELGGDLAAALDLYRQLGSRGDVERLAKTLPPDRSRVDELVAMGRLAEAADLAMQFGEHRRAVDLYNQAGQREAELQALAHLNLTGQESWALERMASLARALGRFDLEAEARSRLDQPVEAAEAYHRAARQVENRTPEKKAEIARFFEQAFELFDGEGMQIEARQCWEKIIVYRSRPWVIIEHGASNKAFLEDTFNRLDLTLRNTGAGVARKVRVCSDSVRFELSQESTNSTIPTIGAGYEQKLALYIRPLKNQVGDLALVLNWEWCDKNDQMYTQSMSWPVTVRRVNEPGGSGTPVEIHYHGPVYQADGGIEIISGDKVDGDQIHGDQLGAGAQKGDKVVVGASNRGQRAARLCPNCGLELGSPSPRFCRECGAEVKKS